MPRALTQQERCAKCQRLLERGAQAVYANGLRRVSVDDIVAAAGYAKGTFYQHFQSKEQYLLALLEKLHRDAFAESERLIAETNDLRNDARSFIGRLFAMPEMAFFIVNEPDIVALLDALPDNELQAFRQAEVELFAAVLRLAGIDMSRVKAGVVHNYLHALYLMKSSDLMTEGDLDETVDLLIDSLINYIFGGVK